MLEVLRFMQERGECGLLPWTAQQAAVVKFGWSHPAVEEVALANSLLPSRYQRNQSMISTTEQLQLFRSRVAVVGCGGLGGFVIEELARLGVGQIVVIDPDVFEEHNLNRQLLATPDTLGKAKVEAAQKRVAEVNPAVRLIPHQVYFRSAASRELLQGVIVAVDALDSISCRLELAESCAEMNIPMVHGAIGGWYGHVATQLPGDGTVQNIYRNWVTGKGIEKDLGNPSFTPAVVAALQVAEVCKLLLGKGSILRRRKLSIDLLDMEMHEISYAEAPEAQWFPVSEPGQEGIAGYR